MAPKFHLPEDLPTSSSSRRTDAALAEELNEADLAVGLLVLLLEGAFVQLLEAEGAHKVFGVELLAHGRDAASRDGLLAAGAQGAAPLVVVRLAVGLAVVVEEAAVHERRETFLEEEEEKKIRIHDNGRDSGRIRAAHPAHEAFGVPQRVEGRDVVLQDGAGTAPAFRGKHVKVVLPAVRLPVLLVEP